ncbi:MAG: hypothetical protein ACJ764_11320 [Solirubrobacteraceae bacterium]
MSSERESSSGRAARLMDLLGLSEDELCQVLDVDPLSLLSGQVDQSSQLPILLDLCREAAERMPPGVLARWIRATGSHGRPIDALLSRDFARFENALDELAERGFVLRAG